MNDCDVSFAIVRCRNGWIFEELDVNTGEAITRQVFLFADSMAEFIEERCGELDGSPLDAAFPDSDE